VVPCSIYCCFTLRPWLHRWRKPLSVTGTTRWISSCAAGCYWVWTACARANWRWRRSSSQICWEYDDRGSWKQPENCRRRAWSSISAVTSTYSTVPVWKPEFASVMQWSSVNTTVCCQGKVCQRDDLRIRIVISGQEATTRFSDWCPADALPTLLRTRRGVSCNAIPCI